MVAIFLKILRASLEVLDTTFVETGQPLADIQAMIKHITALVSNTTRVEKSVDGVTPLMVYAIANVQDERTLNFFKENTPETIRQTIKLSDCTGVSAVTIAALVGSLGTLRLLLETKLFAKEHLEEAVYFAAVNGQAECITYLHSRGVNLFKICNLFRAPFNDRNADGKGTALHIACYLGDVRVVQAILDTKPKDELLDLPIPISGEAATAYDIADFNGHTGCMQLLEHTKAALWDRKIGALTAKNLLETQKLIMHDDSNNPFIADYHRRHECIIGSAAGLLLGDEEYAPIYNGLLFYLEDYPPEVQINSLLLSLSQLLILKLEHANNGNGNNEFLAASSDDMLGRLMALRPHYAEMKNLTFNGMVLEKRVFSVIVEIIDVADIETVDLTMCRREDGVNLHYNLLPEFLWALIFKKKLTECNLVMSETSKRFRKPLDLIIKRNLLIQDVSSEGAKDITWIVKTNEIMETINSYHNCMGFFFFKKLKPSKVYTLRELTAFFIAGREDLLPRAEGLIQDLKNIITEMQTVRQYAGNFFASVKDGKRAIAAPQTSAPFVP